MKRNLISLLITLIVGFIAYYIFLPALNIHSLGFWIYVMFLLFIFLMNSTIGLIASSKTIILDKIKMPKSLGILWGALGIIFVLIFAINIILSPMFNSKSYSKRISINENTSFEKDVEAVDFSKLALLDKDSSQKLGDRVMGQMPELVSQFYVSELYTQINYNDKIVRVTPLEYDGIIKYFTNRKNGVKGYITVDSVTGETELKKLDKGMKYMPSAMFGEDLNRKLRFKYPTKIFGEITFEIDNEGNPYWIAPCLKYSGIGLKKDVEGIVMLNPVTGESKYYSVKDVPTWVDHVYAADVVIEQVNDWGKYKDGFLNSIFGQKNVVATTEGYNYLAMNDDVYLYTGITSAVSDESNIGFILVNLRTKETNYYSVPGAEEYSAMASAEGQVQQMDYKASFPLLINLNNKPTYLISLKDNAGLVKMYAFVDVSDYQKVVVTDSSKGIEEAANKYLESLGETSKSLTEKEIQILNISTSIIDGNTYYYIIDTNNQKYKVSIKTAKDTLPFLKVNDIIKIGYGKEKSVVEINKIY